MIDWKRVAQLRDEVGPDDFAEVVELFLEEVDEVITRLPAAEDARTLESELHFLKGSALNLGFERFGQMCQEGERQAARNALAGLEIEPIRDCYAESRRAFLDALGPGKVG